MTMDIATIATAPGTVPYLAHMLFTRHPDGQLAHYIDGDLRALVPPEGWEAYAEAWPEAIPVINDLKG
jgi:hypothetical protein